MATRLWHLHDFATSELRRFRQEGKGAVAILALMNPLMGVKIRLGRLDGMLEAAELASSLLQTCPGLVRWADERRGGGRRGDSNHVISGLCALFLFYIATYKFAGSHKTTYRCYHLQSTSTAGWLGTCRTPAVLPGGAQTVPNNLDV